MTTKRAGTTTEPARAASTTGRRPSSTTLGKPVRVWGEVSLTIAISDQPPQFIKVTFGHERWAKNDTQEQIKRTERLIHEYNEEVVSKRADQLKRLVEAMD